MLGSNERAARSAIATAARAPQGDVELHVVSGAIEIEARWPGGERADVLLALVRDHASSSVEHGENAGRVLSHVAIARSIQVAGSGAGTFEGRIALERGDDADRALVLVQEPDGGSVLAVGELRLR